MIKILDEQFVNKNLVMKDCIDLMEQALLAIENKECTQYVRTGLQLPNHNILGLMPGYFEDGYFGVKVLSVYPHNSLEGYPSHQGEILLFEKEHGSVLCVVDAMSVTKIRTGAVSALATKYLARKDAKILALLGCGHQAESHLEAIRIVRDIEKVYVYDGVKERAEAFRKLYPDMDITVCDCVKEAVKDADIICTLTPAKEPILEGKWIKPGCHINAVGSCSASTREIDSDVVKMSKLYGDHTDSILAEAGDYLIPLRNGEVEASKYLGTIAQMMTKQIPSRENEEEVTLFEALGLASEDIICADYLYHKGE